MASSVGESLNVRELADGSGRGSVCDARQGQLDPPTVKRPPELGSSPSDRSPAMELMLMYAGGGIGQFRVHRDSSRSAVAFCSRGEAQTYDHGGTLTTSSDKQRIHRAGRRSRSRVDGRTGHRTETPGPRDRATESQEFCCVYSGLPPGCPGEHAVYDDVDGEAEAFLAVAGDHLGGVGDEHREALRRERGERLVERVQVLLEVVIAVAEDASCVLLVGDPCDQE